MTCSVVLVHGAWGGSWCWERVVPLLEQRGLRTVAVDLPSVGADPGYKYLDIQREAIPSLSMSHARNAAIPRPDGFLRGRKGSMKAGRRKRNL